MARAKVNDDFIKPAGTVIGSGFVINGAKFLCSTDESIRIEGTVAGDIAVDGALSLSETGCVEGNITASSIRIAGSTHGDVSCKNSLHLTGTASVYGNISTSVFIVDEGAKFSGFCKTEICED